MSWRHWMRFLAFLAALGFLYVDAARNDEFAHEQDLAAMRELSIPWHP